MTGLIVASAILFGFAGFMFFIRWYCDYTYRKSQEAWGKKHPLAKELYDKAETAYKAYKDFKAEHEDYNKERINELRDLKKYTPSEHHAQYDREIITLQADYWDSMIKLNELRQEWEKAAKKYRNYVE